MSCSLEDEERLSSDLAVFISNPSLTEKLTDGSLDLASYSAVVESELTTLERDCIAIYRDKADEIMTLREEIENCDGVLASLQEMLLGFQADLGGLSGDIRSLQDQSRTLGTKLRNRRDAEAGLRRFLQRVVIPPTLAEVICYAEVDSNFVACVEELNAKYAYVHRGGEDVQDSAGIPPRDTISGKEMMSHIEKLRIRAISRSRDYFLDKISELRKSKTNVRMIQVNSLLKYSTLNDFLSDAAPGIYSEVRDVYIESMCKILYALFRTYQAQLARLDAKIASRNDLIAVENVILKDVFSTKVNFVKKGDVFFLGDRVNVLDLDNNNARPIVAHVAIAEGETFSYEVIFRSLMHHIMDSATNEFIFTRLFFKETGQDAFHLIFSTTLSLLLERLENYLFNCYDCLGLLLMVKLTHANRRIMRSRNIHVLDNFFDRVTTLLWPRLKMVMNSQLRSLKSANAKKLGGVELHPHYVSRRYAEFTSSILLILNKGKNLQKTLQPNLTNSPLKSNNSTQSNHSRQQSFRSIELEPQEFFSPDSSVTNNEAVETFTTAGEMLLQDLSLLTEEIIALLQRLALQQSNKKINQVFLINNLDQIISILQERRVLGVEMARFTEELSQQRELFVEEELFQHFTTLINFVQDTEPQISSYRNSSKTNLDINPATVQSIVQEFSISWKTGIEQINRNVLSYFSNFRNGMEILKQVLTQLLLYYTRFQDIIRKIWRLKQPPFVKDLVSTSVILGEIKKYALAI